MTPFGPPIISNRSVTGPRSMPTRQHRERNTVKKPDLRSLQRLAEKNRKASKAAHDAAEGKEATGKKGKKREFADERPKDDPRYEGVDRLFAEMKKKDRP